jgi:hypothetical protein
MPPGCTHRFILGAMERQLMPLYGAYIGAPR